MKHILLLAQLATTLPLTGLIWTIQVLHYPLFERVGADGFARYHSEHSRLITVIVGPLMLVELIAALGCLHWPSAHVPRYFGTVMLGLVGVVWLTTAFLSVPAHGVLAHGFDAVAHARLVHTNWMRTAAWTVRTVLLLWVIVQELDARST